MELNNYFFIIQSKILEVEDNESLKDGMILEFINFEDSEKKILQNLKIKK